MAKKKLKKVAKTNLEIIQSIRRTWGNVNPVTKVKESKKTYRREKKFNIED